MGYRCSLHIDKNTRPNYNPLGNSEALDINNSRIRYLLCLVDSRSCLCKPSNLQVHRQRSRKPNLHPLVRCPHTGNLLGSGEWQDCRLVKETDSETDLAKAMELASVKRTGQPYTRGRRHQVRCTSYQRIHRLNIAPRDLNKP